MYTKTIFSICVIVFALAVLGFSNTNFTNESHLSGLIEPVFAATEIPSWIKTNAGYWVNGEISDDEFMTALQYLIKEKILVIPIQTEVKDPTISPTSGTPSKTLQLENTLYGPSKYLSFKDSPFFEISKNSQYFYLEDFEDGALNTLGAKVNNGQVLDPGEYTDSVDIDGDGFTDGDGSTGHSLWSDGSYILTFSFDETKLGGLPTFAGIVFTDASYSNDDIHFEAYGPDGNVIDRIDLKDAGDNSNKGTTGEDRFFGIISDSGIKGIKLESTRANFEVDHLQYGR